MTDHDSFLDAIEDDPGDDARWLVFADWLEERGEPLVQSFRDLAGGEPRRIYLGTYLDALGDRPSQLLACDGVERALPGFEEHYPDDRSLRRLLEIIRHPRKGNRLRVLHSKAIRSRDIARADESRDKERYRFAFWTANLACLLIGHPRYVCEESVAMIALSRCREWYSNPSPETRRAHLSALWLEQRWLVARLLRYKLGGPSGS